MIKAIYVLLAVGLLLLSGVVSADNPPDGKAAGKPAGYTLDDLSWLVGTWKGDAFGGVIEEIWHAPSGGSMTGCFKLVTDDEVGFYEFMTITIDSAGPLLRLKHFNADLTGWEKKEQVVVFPFKSMSENKIYFDGLSYARHADDALRITVELKDSENKPADVVIECYRPK
ncbi:MAG: DUF6265 family protein [Candidatus Zixiibacteriota bacterium]